MYIVGLLSGGFMVYMMFSILNRTGNSELLNENFKLRIENTKLKIENMKLKEKI